MPFNRVYTTDFLVSGAVLVPENFILLLQQLPVKGPTGLPDTSSHVWTRLQEYLQNSFFTTGTEVTKP